MRHLLRLAVLGIALLATAPAWSQAARGTIAVTNQPTEPSTGTVAFTGVTVGTAHGNVMAANQVSLYLMLHNPSALGANTVYCSFGGTATVAGAGTLSISPGQYVTFEGSYAPRDAVDCIATGANTPLTIGVQ